MARKRQFTIFDHIDFGDYEFHEFPMMIYPPNGETMVVDAGTVAPDRDGIPRVYGERRDLAYKVVNNKEELAALVELGWHVDPAKSREAAKPRVAVHYVPPAKPQAPPKVAVPAPASLASN